MRPHVTVRREAPPAATGVSEAGVTLVTAGVLAGVVYNVKLPLEVTDPEARSHTVTLKMMPVLMRSDVSQKVIRKVRKGGGVIKGGVIQVRHRTGGKNRMIR